MILPHPQYHITDDMEAEPFLSKLHYFFLNYFLLFVGASMKVIFHICKYSKQHGANAPQSVKV